MLSSIAGITSETKNIFSSYTCCFQRTPKQIISEKNNISGLSTCLCGSFFLQDGPPRDSTSASSGLSEGRFQVLSLTEVCESERRCNRARRCPGDKDSSSIKWNYLHVAMRIHLIPCTYFRFLPFFGEVGEGEKPSSCGSLHRLPLRKS